MKITCQSCQSKHNVATVVQGFADRRGVRQHRRAGERRGGDERIRHGISGPAPSPAFFGDDVQWHVNLGGETDLRTMFSELIDSDNTGGITQDTFIWTDGMDDRSLSEVEAAVAAADAAGGEAAPASGTATAWYVRSHRLPPCKNPHTRPGSGSAWVRGLPPSRRPDAG